jgi:hypothetical protein
VVLSRRRGSAQKLKLGGLGRSSLLSKLKNKSGGKLALSNVSLLGKTARSVKNVDVNL